MALIHLVYISAASHAMSDDDLLQLLEQSRRRNIRQNITGMLLYKDGFFMQVLEGEAADVDDIYGAILRDERNVGPYLIEREPIAARDFRGWAMGFRNLSGFNSDSVPGFSKFMEQDASVLSASERANHALSLLCSFKET